MNEAVNPPSASAPSLDLHQTLARWVRKLFACNPCYLLSAALLLYGFYRVSIDPGFLRTEMAQLRFDLGSLQLYELLLVVTAVWLARRAAWYDSALLVWLENAFILVPFILISQAGLIDQRQVWALCGGAAAILAVRCQTLRRGIAALNLPGRLMTLGIPVLLVNVALPIAYRLLHEHKVGTKPDWGAAYVVNEYTWIVVLPGICSLAGLLPRPRATGPLPLQRMWVPAGLFSLWWFATAVHLYCLGYVYDFDLRRELVAPSLCVLLWVLQWAIPEWRPDFDRTALRLLLPGPLLVMLLAATQPSKEVFLFLTILNGCLYAWRFWQNRDRVALHLLLVCAAAFIGALPQDWLNRLPGHIARETTLGGGVALYAILAALVGRDPRWAVAGALAVFGLGLSGLGAGICSRPLGPHAALQAALVFLLLHSLRWEDGKHRGAKALRLLAAGLWVGDAWLTSRLDGAPVLLVNAGLVPLAMCVVARWWTGYWPARVIPVAAVLVLISAPGAAGAGKLEALPAGVIAVLGSFVLFGCGTLAALTRHRWRPPDKS